MNKTKEEQERIKDAMIAIAYGALITSEKFPGELIGGRKWQQGWEAGARHALLAIAEHCGEPIPALARDHMENAIAFNNPAPLKRAQAIGSFKDAMKDHS